MPQDLSSVLESNEVIKLATGFVFTEGPLWHSDGYLMFVDIRRSLIFKLVPGGEPEVIRENSGGTNGLTFDMNGEMLMCEGDDRRIARMAADGSVSLVVDSLNGKRLNRPNDIITRSDGSIYFTDPQGRVPDDQREIGFAGIHRIQPDGTHDAVIDEFEYPNGLAFSPDESILYVSNTRQGTYIMAYDVASDGTMSNGRRFADLSSDEIDNGVPDGMKVDSEGRVFCTAAGGCWVFDSDGTHLGVIRLPEYPANCAWGGDDHRTLFFTANSSIFSMRMKAPGTRIPKAS